MERTKQNVNTIINKAKGKTANFEAINEAIDLIREGKVEIYFEGKDSCNAFLEACGGKLRTGIMRYNVLRGNLYSEDVWLKMDIDNGDYGDDETADEANETFYDKLYTFFENADHFTVDIM